MSKSAEKEHFHLWLSRKFVAQNSNTIYSTTSVKVLLKLLGSGGIVDLGKFLEHVLENNGMNESLDYLADVDWTVVGVDLFF